MRAGIPELQAYKGPPGHWLGHGPVASARPCEVLRQPVLAPRRRSRSAIIVHGRIRCVMALSLPLSHASQCIVDLLACYAIPDVGSLFTPISRACCSAWVRQ